mmetsp:Transcript_1062/g.2079  ORF Transcript_1062/g.2079 Transcript_1062/m.2079 type:complete len:217 (+) Transcript_1062:925-1575(+)
MDRETRPVAVTEFHLLRQVHVALHRANPAHLRADDGNRLALDHGFKRDFFDAAGLGKLRAPRAAFGLGPESLADLAQFFRDAIPLQRLFGQQVIERGAFFHQAIALGLKLHLLQTPQGAQAHVEDRLDLHFREFAVAGTGRDVILFGHRTHEILTPVFAHQCGLGTFVVADDVDHAVKIEECDQEAFEHLQPVVDLSHAMTRAPQQHVLSMIKEGA